MSLDVYLYDEDRSKPAGSGIFIREDGQMREITRAEWDEKFPGREPVVAVLNDDDSDEVYHANITHNLGRMATEAGIYEVMWRPEEHSIMKASELVAPLRAGLERLKADPEHFKTFNPENGWGDYDGLVMFAEAYLAACEQYPDARVSVWR